MTSESEAASSGDSANPQRRTQAERRSATIEALSSAAIASLAEVGYARTTVAAICERAGVSQGALFGHFETRADLLAHVADLIARRHVAVVDQAVEKDAGVEQLVGLVRSICRSDEHAAWQEIMFCARTEPAVSKVLTVGLADFGRAIEEGTARLGVRDVNEATLVLLGLMHMFDSEAVIRRVRTDTEIEARRFRWACAMVHEIMGDR